ncbi:MAG: hypothetical protein LBT53_02615 [Puniceicoccales bacterium]|jgi:hypothetical protein|nr:hypothetical protein [Puniceicoccales bacterium]
MIKFLKTHTAGEILCCFLAIAAIITAVSSCIHLGLTRAETEGVSSACGLLQKEVRRLTTDKGTLNTLRRLLHDDIEKEAQRTMPDFLAQTTVEKLDFRPAEIPSELPKPDGSADSSVATER